MAQTIAVTLTALNVLIKSPYNSVFVEDARKLGGKFNRDSNSWAFDVRDEQRVRDLCFRVYGNDGVRKDQVTLRIEWIQDTRSSVGPVHALGRTIARASGRDSGAKLGDDVVILAGGFTSGGSMKNWTTEVSTGTIVLVRDFPRVAAEELVAKEKSSYRKYSIEPEAPVMDREALKEERQKLQARIIAINALLGD